MVKAIKWASVKPDSFLTCKSSSACVTMTQLTIMKIKIMLFEAFI